GRGEGAAGDLGELEGQHGRIRRAREDDPIAIGAELPAELLGDRQRQHRLLQLGAGGGPAGHPGVRTAMTWIDEDGASAALTGRSERLAGARSKTRQRWGGEVHDRRRARATSGPGRAQTNPCKQRPPPPTPQRPRGKQGPGGGPPGPPPNSEWDVGCVADRQATV